MNDPHNILLLGIGNTLLSDEGAGIHALNLMQANYPELEGVQYLDGGTLSFSLATWIEAADCLIVFDAAQLQRSTGSIDVFIDGEMDRFLGTNKGSVHEVGLIDLLDIARLTNTLPVHRALIGIQPEKVTWGMSPTPLVATALSTAVDKAIELIECWRYAAADEVSHSKHSSTLAGERLSGQISK